jgi:hypothetical protein
MIDISCVFLGQQMNPEIYSEWLRRRGYRVVRTPSSYWYQVGPLIFQAFPYHWLIRPSQAELEKLLMDQNAIGLRYSTPISEPHGRLSYHVVFSKQEYKISDISKKARYDVNKGLSHTIVKEISLSRLADEGWILRADTLARQGREKAESFHWWKRLCLSAENLPGFEKWGAIHGGQLVAALLSFSCGDCCSILYQQSLASQLKYGVNNALTYAFTNHVLRRGGTSEIFYGLHSLDAPASVDQFKFRMGFTGKAVRQRVVFHPFIAHLFNNHSHRVVQMLLKRGFKSEMIGKIEGLIRFYLEGQRPIDEQPPLPVKLA